jgi:chemotaxis protein MotA
MVTIVGFMVVIGCVLGGFTWAGGHVMHLWHPSEVLTIGGAALGAAIVMSPMKVLKDTVKGVIDCFKGNPFNKALHEELFKLMYELFKTARRNGLLALESHLSNPHDSEIFHRYPKIHHNHHITEFIVGCLAPIMEGSVKPDALPKLLETEIKTMEEEHHAATGVMSKTADGLPGFGIVAAVLGIVITMGHISGPVEEIGHKVGAALVGTFLGILLSYGFIAPLVVKMEANGLSEANFFRTIANIVQGFVSDLPPKVAIEQARRSLASEVRPTREELENMFKAVDAAG